MIKALLMTGIFSLTVVNDPIEDRKSLVFSTADDGHTLSLSCETGTNSLSISVVPDAYYGAHPILGLWSPRGDSRFGKGDKALRDMWRFTPRFIEFDDGKFGSNKRKAEFVDQLSRDDRFSLRYEAIRGDTRTVSISYEVDTEELSAFMARCNPVRVNEYLADWNSPAAP